MRRLVSFFVLFLAMTLTGWSQTTYYVDGTNGDDTDPGTQAAPWATITHAISQAGTAGDIIVVAAGTYTGGLLISGKPLTLRGPNYQVSGAGTRSTEAVIDGYVRVDGSYTVVVEGFHVDGTNFNQSSCNWCMRGFLLGNTSSTSNVTIKNNIIQNWTTGISLAGGSTSGWVDDVVIEGNKFINCSIGSTENATDLTITNNTFQNGGVGFGGGATLTAFTGNVFTGGSSRYVSAAAAVSIDFSTVLTANTFETAVLTTNVSGQWYDRAIFATISGAVTVAPSGGTLTVSAGTYQEVVNINKSLTLTGAGASTTTIEGPVLSSSSDPDQTVILNADNITFQGFTVTRAGNNSTYWPDNGTYPRANRNGIIIAQSKTGCVIQNCIVTGNRNGIYLNNTQNHTIQNNTITDNRTGVQFVNNVSGCTLEDNTITNNWTMGVLFYYNSNTVATSNFSADNNNISGNWYSQVEVKTVGTYPASNAYAFTSNYFGATTPVVTTTLAGEPSYNSQIPVAFGGTATAPSSTNGDITGDQSAMLTYSPWLAAVPGSSPMTWGTNDNIQTAIASASAGDIINVDAGTYAASLNVSKSLTLQSTVASGSSTGAPVIQGLVTVGADNVTIKGLKITNPSGNAIYAAGRSNLAILDNLFEAVGTTSTTNVHAITLTGSSTASTEILDDVLIDGNAFSNIGNPSGSQSSSAITVGFSTHSFELTNLVITENVISDVNANITNKGAYGILINVGANGSGNVTAPIISTNTISDLEGYWAHAIGMEGNTPNALVEDNVISDVTDHKATPDAVAVMVEDNANAGTLTIRNNYFLQNVAVGVVRTSSCTGTVNASNNYWNDNDGPCTPTLYSGPGCTGYGAGVTDNVVFEPWIGQATVMPAATIPNTTMDIGDDDITEFELQYDAVPETGGTIYITTYDTAPAGTTAPVGASVYKYVEITSDMPNGTFGIWITLTVTAGSQAGNFLETPADADVKRLAYFNESTNSWVLVSGSYSSLPASTAGVFDHATGTAEFTFFADHFTVFAFIGGSSASYYNTPATAYPLYVAMAPVANLNLASNRTVYPNNTWSGGYPGRTDDWGFSGSQPITVYLVPGNSSTFFSGSTTLQWTNGMLGSTVSVSASDGTYNGLFTGANRILDSDMLGTTNSIRIDAARSDNLNYDPAVTGEEIATGDFIVKLGLQLLKPGSTGIDVIGADYRRYVNSTTPSQYVYVEPFGTTIKAYLGDVANSSDQTSGDGLINTADLNIWSAAYWSGVSGFSGGLTNYKTKFDIGPTTDGTPFTLPVPDTKIEFEDLVIFSISYGLSAANALPKYDENFGSIGLELGAPVRDGSEIRVPVLLNGTNADVRALKLRLDGVTGRFLGFEHGELLAGRGNPVPVFSMQDDSRLAIDLAVLGLDTRPIAGSGELLWLRFDATEMPRVTEAEARTSLNRSIRVALNDATAAGFSLAQNYPNPFNPSTTITFTLDRDAEIDLSVYNTFGQKVATILSGSALAGTQQVSWNGTDDAGSALPSGVYIYRLSAGGNTLQRSMMLAK